MKLNVGLISRSCAYVALLLFAACSCLALAGCGGNDDASPNAQTALSSASLDDKREKTSIAFVEALAANWEEVDGGYQPIPSEERNNWRQYVSPESALYQEWGELDDPNEQAILVQGGAPQVVLSAEVIYVEGNSYFVGVDTAVVVDGASTLDYGRQLVIEVVFGDDNLIAHAYCRNEAANESFTTSAVNGTAPNPGSETERDLQHVGTTHFYEVSGNTLITPYYRVDIPENWGDATFSVHDAFGDYLPGEGGEGVANGYFCEVKLPEGFILVACFRNGIGWQGDYRSIRKEETPALLPDWFVGVAVSREGAFCDRLDEAASFVTVENELGGFTEGIDLNIPSDYYQVNAFLTQNIDSLLPDESINGRVGIIVLANSATELKDGTYAIAFDAYDSQGGDTYYGGDASYLSMSPQALLDRLGASAPFASGTTTISLTGNSQEPFALAS